MRDWIIINPATVLSGKALMRAITSQVAQAHGVSYEDMINRDRREHIAAARLEAYYRIRQTNRFSYPQIGKFFGRDHTTILTGVSRHEVLALAKQEAA